MTDGIGGERWRLLGASAIGTIIEWYDFFIFATCAVLVFDKTFFPASSTYTGILLALSSYAIGFVARPLGGILFGTLGDRIGRKNALVASLALMGVSTMLMGALPTHAAVGLLAPALLVGLRILQGVAVGGEATGALTMVAESMPGANRGFWVSFPMLGGPVANVLAALTIIVIQRDLGEPAFVAWAWRLPFLFSGVLVLLGIWVRMRIEESPAFLALAKSRQGTPRAPLSEAFVGWGRPMLKVFLIKTSENTLFYLFTTFFLVLVTQYLALSRGAGLDALYWGSLLEAAVIMATGVVADRVGRRPVLLVGFCTGLCAGYVLFTLDKGASAQTVLLVTLATLTLPRHHRRRHVAVLPRTVPDARALHGHVDGLSGRLRRRRLRGADRRHVSPECDRAADHHRPLCDGHGHPGHSLRAAVARDARDRSHRARCGLRDAEAVGRRAEPASLARWTLRRSSIYATGIGRNGTRRRSPGFAWTSGG